MSTEANIKSRLFQSIIQYVREHYPESIDKAYAYFWDDQNPVEFLSGTALEIGFINFEDWLICDYRSKDNAECFIDIYCELTSALTEKERNVLERMQSSVISLYEVVSVAKDKHVKVRDLLFDGGYTLREKALSEGLKKGDIFGARLLNLDGEHVLSGCVYPFAADQKKKVLAYIEKMFGRYTRNENPEGTMKDFLKAYGDTFNIAWMKILIS